MGKRRLPCYIAFTLFELLTPVYVPQVQAQSKDTPVVGGAASDSVCTLTGEPLVDCAAPPQVESRFLGENFLFDRRRLGVEK